MARTLDKLKKLRGRGADELVARGAQAAAAFAERRGWSPDARLPTDARLRVLLDPSVTSPHGGASGGAVIDAPLAHFRARRAPAFFAGFDDDAATREELRRRFAAGEGELIRQAEKIVAGRFDLLGLCDLSFGAPIDWALEPVSGRRPPAAHWSRIDYLDPQVAGDKKVTWELNRHQHFTTLGRAYRCTGDERYAETFAAHLSAWAAANPPKRGVNWASSLEVAFRAVSWTWALHFFRDSAALTPALFSLALKLLYLHARHLETYLSTYFSPNTHLTGEALGLFHLGTVWPEFRRARRWRETGARVLLAELDRQVLPDGVYFEQSSYYQRYTADFYTHFLLLARATGSLAAAQERKVESKLTALLDHLTFITRPDGRTPLYGDDDGGRLMPLDERPRDDFRSTLATAAALLSRPDYKFVAGQATEETLWLLGPAGLAAFDLLEARPPAETSRAFPDGGCYVMRDGWRADSNFMLLDAGPHGALSFGHSHADALSFELSARGRAVLLDPGTYTYTGGRAERDRFRSTRAHNALTVDGESSSVPAGTFSWSHVAAARAKRWTSHPRFDYFEGGHDGYRRLAPPVAVERAVLFLKGDYWVVRDRARVERGARRALALNFQFAPGAAPRLEREPGAEALVERGGGGDGDAAGLKLYAFGPAGRWREEPGYVSRCYGSRDEAPHFAYEAEASGAQEFHTLLLPFAAGEPADLSVRRLEATGGHLFEISRRGSETYDVLLASGGAYVESGRFASDFEWAWARFRGDAETPEELVLVAGRRFSLYGRELVKLPNHAPYVYARREGPRLIVETNTGRTTQRLAEEPAGVTGDR